MVEEKLKKESVTRCPSATRRTFAPQNKALE
jgi:hypothetical protein